MIGKPVYLRETVRGTDEAARRAARKALTGLWPRRTGRAAFLVISLVT